MPLLSALRRSLRRLGGGAPARLAIEVDERGARLLVVRRAGAGVQVERFLGIDLRADGLLSPGEMAARLRELLSALPAAEATLVLPVGRTHSQLMELRGEEGRGVADLAGSLGGRQFASVPSVFDGRPLRPGSRHRRPMWVSIAREADVSLHLLRCGIPAERVAGVIGADGALAAAFTTLPGRPSLAVLIELGATSGLLVVVEDDQPVFAADLEGGMETFALALSADLGCNVRAAEAILARDGAEAAGQATPRLTGALQTLGRSVAGLLQDYAREAGREESELAAAPRWLSGAGLEVATLRELLGLAFGDGQVRAWPVLESADGAKVVLNAGVLAYGAAAVALALAASPPNLAPAEIRSARRAEHLLGGLQTAGLGIGLVALVVTGWVLHGRLAGVRARTAEAEAVRAAHAAVPAVLAGRKERDAAYVEAAPLLYLQKRTRDFISGVRLLRAGRGAGDFWFALIADQETYRAGSLPQGTPSAAAEAQLLPGCMARPSGLVVELSFRPGQGEPLTQVGALITELRAAAFFTGVDILPARARQAALADRSVFAVEGADYALQLDTAPFDGTLPGSVVPAAQPAAGGLFQSTP